LITLAAILAAAWAASTPASATGSSWAHPLDLDCRGHDEQMNADISYRTGRSGHRALR